MNLAIIDNYDSFTYNIAHIVRTHQAVNLQIITAGEVVLDNITGFDKIIFSPGPDLPADGNIMEQILKRYDSSVSILGICLGMQAIVRYYGGTLCRLSKVVHGRTKTVLKTVNHSRLFKGLPDSFEAGFYHSWIADKDKLPDCLEVTAHSDEKRIMAVRHKELDIEGVQFHPESFMTPHGISIINNWINE